MDNISVVCMIGLYRRCIINLLPVREQASQLTLERLNFGNSEFFMPDGCGSGGPRGRDETRDYEDFGVKIEPTWGERLSKDAFWVLDYLQGIGPSRHLRGLAEVEGINYDAGLDELRKQGLLDESNPDYPEANIPKPKP